MFGDIVVCLYYGIMFWRMVFIFKYWKREMDLWKELLYMCFKE